MATRVLRTIGGMDELEALTMTYGVAYRHLQTQGVSTPSHIDCDLVISEYRHSHQGKVIGAVSEWLCDSKAWVGKEDDRRYKLTRRAYLAVKKGDGVA